MSGYNYVTWYNATGLLIRLGVPVRPSDSIGLFGTWGRLLGEWGHGGSSRAPLFSDRSKNCVVTSAGYFSKPRPHSAPVLIPAMLNGVNPSFAFPARAG